MATKLDTGKAYDGHDWDFIKICFTNSGFFDKWINWIMQGITTPSFRVMVNGRT